MTISPIWVTMRCMAAVVLVTSGDCAYICMYVDIGTDIDTDVDMYIYLYVYIYTYMSTCMSTYLYYMYQYIWRFCISLSSCRYDVKYTHTHMTHHTHASHTHIIYTPHFCACISYGIIETNTLRQTCIYMHRDISRVSE